jgi:hypothetical protein
MTGGKECLEEKIKKEISNSGFPLEIYSSIILNKHQWNVRPALNYYDKNLGEYRENDILANKKVDGASIINFLVIECKKSAKNPWVFIKTPRKTLLSENLNIVHSQSCKIIYPSLENTMKFHHYSYTPNCYASFVACTNDQNTHANDQSKNSKISQSIFHAKNQILSALMQFEDQWTTMNRPSQCNTLIFFYPIIVFEGLLYSATITEGDIQLSEESHLLLNVERECAIKQNIYLDTTTLRRQIYKPYLIDIVKKEYFEKFLSNFSKYYDEATSDILKSIQKN